MTTSRGPGAHTPPLPDLTEANDIVRRAYSKMKEEWHLALMKWRDAGTEPLRVELEEYLRELHKRDLAEMDLEKEAMLATLTSPEMRGAFVTRWLARRGGCRRWTLLRVCGATFMAMSEDVRGS